MADEPLVVEIRFPLPQGPIPRLVQVIYNNRLMCSGSKGNVVFLEQYFFPHFQELRIFLYFQKLNSYFISSVRIHFSCILFSTDIASPAHPLVSNIRLQSVRNTKSAGGKNQQDNGFATSGTINQQTPGTLPDLDYSPPTVVRREPEYKPTPPVRRGPNNRPRHIPPSTTSPVREPTIQTDNCGMR